MQLRLLVGLTPRRHDFVGGEILPRVVNVYGWDRSCPGDVLAVTRTVYALSLVADLATPKDEISRRAPSAAGASVPTRFMQKPQ
jgi:hypothetical protein